ncbi:MAG: ribose-phosphate pyrophosphokinase [Chloroflexi bacterium]|nr:ribose-phosphate pyrophosphokinase [Chloroflexota bacterium]
MAPPCLRRGLCATLGGETSPGYEERCSRLLDGGISVFRDLPLSVFTGNTHPGLAQAVCDYLNIPLGSADVFEFSNENIFVRINENIRQHDVFLIQPTCAPVNKGLMELLIMIDAVKRASAGRITAVIPFYGYSRTDKKDQPRVPITARLVADLLEVAGANRILTVDLHAGQIQGFFRIPVDELTALYILTRHFREKRLEDPVVVAADIGGAKKARNFAERLNAPFAIIEKRRARNDDVSEALNVIGEVEGHPAIIVDDEIDTAGTLIEAVAALETHGVTEVHACATHGIFSGPAIERISKSSLKQVVVTDTAPLPPHKQTPKVITLSIAPLLGEAIHRIHTGQSVGAMFEE